MVKRLAIPFWMLVCLVCSGQVKAENPKNFHNEYQARMYGFAIRVISDFHESGNGTYHFNFSADSRIAAIQEQSEMRWDEARRQFVPLHFKYSKTVFGREKKQELIFDWDNMRVKDILNQDNWALPDNANIQDDLSYQVQMRQDVMDGKVQFDYLIAEGGQLKEYPFSLLGEEIIETPMGQVASYKISRNHGSSKRATYAWLAKDWNCLLVALEHHEKGSTYRLLINKAYVNDRELVSLEK